MLRNKSRPPVSELTYEVVVRIKTSLMDNLQLLASGCRVSRFQM
jgi:hypothetical protein